MSTRRDFLTREAPAIGLTALGICLGLNTSCTNNQARLFKALVNINKVKQLSINGDSKEENQIEIDNFHHIVRGYTIACNVFYKHIQNQPGNEDLELPTLAEIITLRYKESRGIAGQYPEGTNIASRLGQMHQPAVDETHAFIQPDKLSQEIQKQCIQNNVSNSTTPIYAQECLESMLYYSKLKNKYLTTYFQEQEVDVDQTDLIKFTAVSYNLGISVFKKLYAALQYPNTWPKFVKACERMAAQRNVTIQDKREETNKAYGVSGHQGFFIDPKHHTETFFQSGSDIILFKKLDILLRYVTLTTRMRQQIIKQESSRKIAESFQKPLNGKTHQQQVSQWIRKNESYQSRSPIKKGARQELTSIILLQNGYWLDDEGKAHRINHQGKKTLPESQRIRIHNTTLNGFLVDKEFIGYKHTKIKFSAKKKFYLYSIIQHIIENGETIDANGRRKKYQTPWEPEKGHKNHQEHSHDKTDKIVKRQLLTEAITAYNQAHYYHGRNPEDADEVLIPERDFINKFDQEEIPQRPEKTSPPPSPSSPPPKKAPKKRPRQKPSKVSIKKGVNKREEGTYYIDPNDEKRGTELLGSELGDQIEEKFAQIAKKPNGQATRIKNNKLKGEKKSKETTHVMLHGTETPKISPKGYNNLRCHIYIAPQGGVFQMTGTVKKGEIINGISIEDLKIKYNHGGQSITSKYGALREGDDQMTYKSIGIEIDTSPRNGYAISDKQYESLAWVLPLISWKLGIPIHNIIYHLQAAYSGRRENRGRKQDPMTFDMKKLNYYLKKNGFKPIPNIGSIRDTDLEKGTITINGETQNVSPNLTAIRETMKEKMKQGNPTMNEKEIDRLIQEQTAYLEYAKEKKRTKQKATIPVNPLLSQKGYAFIEVKNRRNAKKSVLYYNNKKVIIERGDYEFHVTKKNKKKCTIAVYKNRQKKDEKEITNRQRKNNTGQTEETDNTFMRMVTNAIRVKMRISAHCTGNLTNEFEKAYDLLRK